METLIGKTMAGITLDLAAQSASVPKRFPRRNTVTITTFKTRRHGPW